MLFSSITFLYWFLPCTLVLYFLVPKQLKNTVLLLASLLFYAWGEPKYVLLMVLTILCGYAAGILIEKYRGRIGARLTLWASAAVFLGCLGYFKYADFFITNFNAVTGLSVPLLQIALPIGISFYTFQILSYTIDVYRKDTAAQKNPITLAAYVSLFPQLIAGPIVRYSDVEKQLGNRTHSIPKAALGIRRFVLGLSKKIFIANVLGELCAEFQGTQDNSVLFCWMYALAYSLQIYFDFSGYSDMAIGLGKIFGFDFMENFNYPYISRSITEFWRRWHISLGTWFRDYVYIPLGGNRVSKGRWFFNIFVVWLLTGFWHGAAWNFILWGLYFAVFLVAEKLFLLQYLQKTKVLSHLYVLLLAVISFVIFGAPDMGAAWDILRGMAGLDGMPLISDEALYYLRSFGLIILLACIGATPIPRIAAACLQKKAEPAFVVLEPLVLAVLLLAVTAYLVNGSFNPFLYFRF